MSDGHTQNVIFTKVERENLMEMISHIWNLIGIFFFLIVINLFFTINFQVEYFV